MTNSGSRLRTRIVAPLVVAVIAVPALPAHASVGPVDPGPIAAGRPIVGTTINLPSLPTTPPTAPYNAGAQFAAAISAYYANGSAAADQADVAQAARRWTRQWLDRACGGRSEAKVRQCRAMAVFDIDETLLDNYSYYSTQSPAFTYTATTWGPYQGQCASPGVPATVRLLRSLRSAGMGIAIVTGRNESDRAVTEACLRQNGIDGWDVLVMRDSTTSGLSAAAYKAQVRRGLQAQGWRIGPSIGDQVSDMAGGHLRRGFLLPNPMYYIP